MVWLLGSAWGGDPHNQTPLAQIEL